MQQTNSAKSLIQVSKLDLDVLNRRFAVAHPKDILAWCVENIPQGLVQASAFNVDDIVVTDLLCRYSHPKKPIPVIFLDTLHHFPETLAFVNYARGFFELDVRIYKTLEVDSREAFAKKYGKALWEKDLEKFHTLTKIEPLQRGLTELKAVAWITGRRRDQVAARAEMPIFEQDQQNRLKINPLATWTRRESWAHIFEYDLIHHPLYDQGYASIGDEPLTTPIVEGESERDGRWRGSNTKESGIHF